MTRRESAIVSAFTGFLAGPFDAFHEYVEEKMGRPVFTSEFGNKVFAEAVKEAAKDDFVALANSVGCK